MIKILFLINSLGGGGAERVMVNLLNNIDLSKYDVTVQVIFKGGVNRSSLRSEIHYIESNMPFCRGISRLFKILSPKLLYKFYIRDYYDLVIAYMHGLPTKILQGKPHGVKSIAWLHTSMSNSSLPKFFCQNQIVPAFDSFDRIVGVGNNVSESFVKMYGLVQKVVTCYNTNDVNAIKQLAEETMGIDKWSSYKKGLRLVTIGRLGPEKGYDRLIRCCALLRNERYQFKLLILGQGSEEAFLKELQQNLHLEDIVIFGGYQSNPFPYLKHGDLFVVSSLFEGLNTAMCEALILGTPVISTMVSGATEILGENSDYGLLVNNDEESLFIGIKQLMSTPELLEHYRAKAQDRALFFDTAKTVKAVEDLIDEVVKEENKP